MWIDFSVLVSDFSTYSPLIIMLAVDTLQVGASELAFRLLCRRYGAQLAYTPMMSAEKFARDASYRAEEFQTSPLDRPLVAHFAANNPQVLVAAAKHVENVADAIDINLGCPQRVAHTGHFGSFLLGVEDRELVLSMVRTASSSLSIPVFVKIRLLDTVEETILLCKQLAEAGAALIAVHARYRVNLVGRTGAGARDGLAHLDQVQAIKAALPHVPVIANGNIRCFDDVIANLDSTGADGVMSAEGILDNPALFVENVENAPSTLDLAAEYLELAEQYPVKLKSLVFHIRRMCCKQLEKYQLMEECLGATGLAELVQVVQQMRTYEHQGGFKFDPHKQRRAQDALARKKSEEGKRNAYEDRMKRKAKREGLDPCHYLNLGAVNPTEEELDHLRKLPKEKAFELWKKNHSQHCYSYHFDAGGCPRDRTCAFLHADASANVALYG